MYDYHCLTRLYTQCMVSIVSWENEVNSILLDTLGKDIEEFTSFDWSYHYSIGDTPAKAVNLLFSLLESEKT